jgi:hypothetical protein
VGRRALGGAGEDGGTTGEVRYRQTLPPPRRRPLRGRRADGVWGGMTRNATGGGGETKRYVCNRWQLRVISGKLLSKPLKAGGSWLLELYYGKDSFASGFCHSQSPLVQLPAFGQIQSR